MGQPEICGIPGVQATIGIAGASLLFSINGSQAKMPSLEKVPRRCGIKKGCLVQTKGIIGEDNTFWGSPRSLRHLVTFSMGSSKSVLLCVKELQEIKARQDQDKVTCYQSINQSIT